jgi:hypothetical protein
VLFDALKEEDVRLPCASSLAYTARMLKVAHVVSVAISVFALGCASNPPPPPATTSSSDEHAKHEGDHHAEGHKDEHEQLSPALKDFHGVIAPVWHSEPGATRVEKACASTKAMQEKATATNDAALVTAAKDLDAACAKSDKGEVEAKLKVVHERFHALAEKH